MDTDGGREQLKVGVYSNDNTRVVDATTKSYSYTPVKTALDPAKGPFTWRLTAVTANNTNSVTEVRSFSLSGNLPTTADAPLTPHSGRTTDPATERAPSLTWEPWSGADHYAVFVREAGASAWWSPTTDEIFTQELTYPAVTDTGARLLRPGNYEWQVIAYNGSNQALGTGPISTMKIARSSRSAARRSPWTAEPSTPDSAVTLTSTRTASPDRAATRCRQRPRSHGTRSPEPPST